MNIHSARKRSGREQGADESLFADTNAHQHPTLSRRIVELALPSLGSLLAEPLMVLADSAMVGHLGTAQLAGLTLASSVNVFIVGMCIFLVYTTTAVAARKLGAGDRYGAIKTGIDGAWLGFFLGAVLAVALFFGAPLLMSFFSADQAVLMHGVAYMRTSCWSMIGMMLVLAGTGALRGQLDTRTPLYISVAGACTNVALNAVFIFVADMGVAGAGLGTALASIGMGCAFILKIFQGARKIGRETRDSSVVTAVSLIPEFRGIVKALFDGIPLMIRTLTMHIVIMATLWVAASQGNIVVAGRQIAYTVWNLSSNVLDALAIAGQVLIGYELGKTSARCSDMCDDRNSRGADVVQKKSPVQILIKKLACWGACAGVMMGVLIAVASPYLPRVFSGDADVVRAGMWALIVSAVLMPIAGVVYLYDGVLIGANDTWYLACAGIVNCVVYAPALVAVWRWAPADPALALALLWGCYCGVFFLARYVTLKLRIRTENWMNLQSADTEDARDSGIREPNA